MKKSAFGAMALGLAVATTACSTHAPSPNTYIDQAKSAAAQADQAGQQAARVLAAAGLELTTRRVEPTLEDLLVSLLR